MKSLAYLSCLGLVSIGSLLAQESVDTHKFTIAGGVGFTTPVGSTGRRLDTGWNLRGGGGYNFNSQVGLMLNFGFDDFGINSSTLSSIGVPGGALHVFSATIDPIVHVHRRGRADVYVTGGAGLFHRYQEFTQPAVTITTGFDPFFGFYPVALSGNQILASYSVNKPGIDIGAGIAIGTKWQGKFFAEARYNRIFMRDSHSDYVPVTFGYRW